MKFFLSALLVVILAESAAAFTLPRAGSTSCLTTASSPNVATTRLYSTDTAQESAFAAFADSLVEEDAEQEEEEEEPWQARLETLLDPTTPLAQRQILLSELLSANQEIRDSVQAALRDRKIDPLLTPTGKKWQEGSRAVARQLTTDILPSLAKTASTPPNLNEVLPKIGSRVLNALGSQAKLISKELQDDLADPSRRIPQRISQQTRDLTKEAKNVFLETPEGLEGPEYKVVEVKEGYEIRDYPGYTVASTTMGKVGEPYSMDDVASGGAAFNSLAAYLFGANQAGKIMEMTTPVTTTSLGEMRFFLKEEARDDIPQPLQDSSNSQYETGAVQLVDIQAARLAVKRFTGFVTEGEVARQKDALLNELALDGVEIDVPHGAVVPHVIFQYNPPYTIPIVRRNELAVPVRAETEYAVEDLEKEWGQGEEKQEDDIAPSDVE